ncbi:MAG TPA: TlpA disulfide reductase family protein [Anaerolineales bacterium]|nr:TlpA disulfide reductase family protein [Anaerolineales bacterium]
MPYSPDKPSFFPAAGLTLILCAVWIFLSSGAERAAAGELPPAPQAGFPAPDFTLQTIEGETITLSDLAGRPVLVNLWASWCAPCRAEMPALQRTYERFKDSGFVVLAVNVTAQDSREAVEAFVSTHELTFPILLDPEGVVTSLYENRALPSSYFIRPDGVVSEVVIGGPMAEVLIVTRIETLFTIGAP